MDSAVSAEILNQLTTLKNALLSQITSVMPLAFAIIIPVVVLVFAVRFFMNLTRH